MGVVIWNFEKIISQKLCNYGNKIYEFIRLK